MVKRALAAAVTAVALSTAGATVASAQPQAPMVSTGWFGNSCGPGLIAFGQLAKTAHWTAEEMIAVLQLQPLFSLIDKPIIHMILWTPLAQLTCVPVDSHPPGIG